MPLVSLGDRVPITYQEPMGVGHYYVRSVVMDPDGATLASFVLVHVGLGSYILSTPYSMPNLQYVLAQYQVFTDPGLTMPSMMHGVVEEKFVLAMIQDNGNGSVTVSSSGCEIVGQVIDSQVTGEVISSDEISATVLSDQDLSGIVDHTNIAGAIDDQKMIGLVSDFQTEGNVE